MPKAREINKPEFAVACSFMARAFSWDQGRAASPLQASFCSTWLSWIGATSTDLASPSTVLCSGMSHFTHPHLETLESSDKRLIYNFIILELAG